MNSNRWTVCFDSVFVFLLPGDGVVAVAHRATVRLVAAVTVTVTVPPTPWRIRREAQTLRVPLNGLARVLLTPITDTRPQLASFRLSVQYRQTVVAPRGAFLPFEQFRAVTFVVAKGRVTRSVSATDEFSQRTTDVRVLVVNTLHGIHHIATADLHTPLVIQAKTLATAVTLHEVSSFLILSAQQRNDSNPTVQRTHVSVTAEQRPTVDEVAVQSHSASNSGHALLLGSLARFSSLVTYTECEKAKQQRHDPCPGDSLCRLPCIFFHCTNGPSTCLTYCYQHSTFITRGVDNSIYLSFSTAFSSVPIFCCSELRTVETVCWNTYEKVENKMETFQTKTGGIYKQSISLPKILSFSLRSFTPAQCTWCEKKPPWDRKSANLATCCVLKREAETKERNKHGERFGSLTMPEKLPDAKIQSFCLNRRSVNKLMQIRSQVSSGTGTSRIENISDREFRLNWLR